MLFNIGFESATLSAIENCDFKRLYLVHHHCKCKIITIYFNWNPREYKSTSRCDGNHINKTYPNFTTLLKRVQRFKASDKIKVLRHDRKQCTIFVRTSCILFTTFIPFLYCYCFVFYASPSIQSKFNLKLSKVTTVPIKQLKCYLNQYHVLSYQDKGL